MCTGAETSTKAAKSSETERRGEKMENMDTRRLGPRSRSASQVLVQVQVLEPRQALVAQAMAAVQHFGSAAAQVVDPDRPSSAAPPPSQSWIRRSRSWFTEV